MKVERDADDQPDLVTFYINVESLNSFSSEVSGSGEEKVGLGLNGKG